MRESRSSYVMKNASTAIVMQLIKNLLAFLGRTVFVYVLGAEYLGVNSLFSEILTLLSFAELGIGNAMVFSLYKPLAEKDTEKIKSLMRLYEKAYRIIGCVIAILGIAIVPFLRYIVGDVSYVKENLELLYLLFLLNSVVSYFFVYKKSLIIADQKNYVVEIYQEIFHCIQVIAQCIFLVITKQFILYLIINVATTIANNIFMARRADKMYPYLKDKNIEELPKEETKGIFQNVKALVFYKIGGIILESTDSIFISTLIDVITVGLYSNYKMVINVFKTIGAQIMNSIMASVGNLNATSGTEKKKEVFNQSFFLSAWFFGFTTTGLYALLTDLVSVWLGSDYIIGANAVLAACVYYFVSNMHYPCYTYRTTAGLFVFGKYVPLICAGLNILLDIILGTRFGLSGILWASTISRLFTYEIIDPIIVYKRVFEENVLDYFLLYAKYLLIVLCDALLSYKIAQIIPLGGFGGLIIRAIVITIVFNSVFILATVRSAEFGGIYNRVKNVLIKKGK